MAEPSLDAAYSGDPFLEEVLNLFVLEAEEWVEQGRRALRELECLQSGAPAGVLEPFMSAMANLGGSAATVELHAVEHIAFGLLLVLTAARECGFLHMTDTATLRAGLDCLTSAARYLDDAKRGTVAGADVLERLLGDVDDVTEAVPSAPPPPDVQGILAELLRYAEATRERRVFDAVNQRALELYGLEGLSRLDAERLQRLLDEQATAEAELLNQVEQQATAIMAGLLAPEPCADQALSRRRLGTHLGRSTC